MNVLQKSRGSWLAMPTVQLIVLFCLFDAIAGVCAWLWVNDIFLETRFFRLDRDRGFSEIIQYAKLAIVITLVWRAFRDTRQEVLRAWAILFWVMLFDDMAGLHEELGQWFLEVLPVPDIGGVEPHAITEILAFGLLEGTALAYVGLRFLFAPALWQKFSLLLLALFVPLILSGIVLDAAGVKYLESIGEILSMTAMLWFVHARLYQYTSSAGSQ